MDNPKNRFLPRLTCRREVWCLAVFISIVVAFVSRSPAEPKVPTEASETPDSAETAAEKAAKVETQKKIAALVEKLGDSDYFVRQKAQDELSGMGFGAFEALTAATLQDDLEIATRAKYLLKLMRVEWAAASDPPEVKRLLKGYEMLNAESREERIQTLAALPDGKATAALCRLARYEKSDVLSKRAALELMQSTPNGEPPAMQRANLIYRSIERGSRPAVRWINAWLRLARDGQVALDEIKGLIDAETQILERNPEETNAELVAAFMRYYISQLKRLGQNEAVAKAMGGLIDLQRDDSSALVELADWFLEQKAWEPLNGLSQRFAPRFAAEPMLLYILAAAKLSQNEPAKAEEIAQQALKLNSGGDSLPQHYLIAMHLRKKGHTAWAINEFEHLIARSSDQDMIAYRSVFLLAEMYHDQDRNLEAGRTIEKYLKKNSIRRLFTPNFNSEYSLEQAKSDMYYYFGCHWQNKGDRKQQRENMEQAIKSDPTGINALIGYYQLPDLTAEEKKRISELVKKTADETRESIRNIQKDSDDSRESILSDVSEANDCNQFAWLVANTEGNADEALKYARRAVELQPGSGGILDTLAHVYYAKGDYENAVKTEEKAFEFEPHSGLIKKKLELFKKALAEKK